MLDQHFEDKTAVSVSDVTDDIEYRRFAEESAKGIRLIPNHTGSLEADYGDFVKWLRAEQPTFSVDYPKDATKIILHGADTWLPLILLAGDTSMQVFLNMLASYLYDRAKGRLRTDKQRIHFSVMYQNKPEGVLKKFEFSGDADALTKAVKRFDLNNFFDDAEV